MSRLDQQQYRPAYPAFSERGMEDNSDTWAPDRLPSGFGPGYSVYASAHGRNLAGVDNHNFDAENSEGIDTYPNELNLLGAADDVDGNGVFDPHGSHGNIHPDTGIFQDHESLPGYVARDHFYRASEVTDLTKGGKVNYVPGGAVAFQQGQKETIANNVLWQIPPGMGWESEKLSQQSTVEAPTPTWQVAGLSGGEDAQRAQYFMLAAGAGLAIGLGVALMMRRK